MDIAEQIIQSCNNAIEEETNNVISKETNHTLQYEQTHDVVLPPEEKKIAINVSALRKVRNECERAEKTKFTYAELWLGISTLLLGAFLSALMSKIPYELNFLSVLFYSICPIGGAGFGVAYFFCRSSNNMDVVQLAEKIEDYLPDLKEMEEQENEH